MSTVKNTSKRKKSILLRVVLLGFSVYIMITAGSLQVDLIKSRKELEERTKAKDELRISVAELTDLLESGTEKDFIERAAREKLNYAFPDETVFEDQSGK